MRILPVAGLCAALLPAGPAGAFMIYPDRTDPEVLVAFIEKPWGDRVDFRYLPKPFDRALQTAQGPARFVYRWSYPIGRHGGEAYLTVSPDGAGTLNIAFMGGTMPENGALAAAAVLVDAEGRPLHAFLARAHFAAGAFSGGGDRETLSLSLERPTEWWAGVGGIAFLYMSYDGGRQLGDAGVRVAMLRAVSRFTGGRPVEQSWD